MNPSVEGQQRRVVNSLVRRNLQGWGRPPDFTEQRLRLGTIFGGLGAVLLFVRQVLGQTHLTFLVSALTLLALLTLAFCLSTFFTHIVPFVRARTQPPTALIGTLEAVICDPQEYSSLARGDYYFITVRPASGRLQAFAVEAEKHADICTRGGQQVMLDIIPGIDYIINIR